MVKPRLFPCLILTGLILIFLSISCNNEGIKQKDTSRLLQLDSLYKRAEILKNTSPESLYNFLLVINENISSINDSSVKLDFYNKQGNLLSTFPEYYKKAKESHNQALEIALKINNKAGIIKAYEGLSIISRETGKYNDALRYCQKALVIANEINYEKLDELYISTGNIYYKCNEPDTAEWCLKMAMKLCKTKDNITYIRAKHCLAAMLMDKKMLDSSLVILNQCVQYYQKENIETKLIAAYNTIGAIYREKKDYKKAFTYMFRAADMGEKLHTNIAYIYTNIGTIYEYDMFDLKKSTEYYELALKKSTNAKEKLEILQSLIQVYYDRGDCPKAIYTLNTFVKEKEIYDINESRLLRQKLEVEYKVQLNQRKIEKLIHEQNMHQVIIKQKNIIILSISILLTSMLGIGLFFNRLKNLKSENQQINLEQRLLRSQMNPHFIFNAISVIQYFIRENQNGDADNYLSKFSRLLRLSLENSREELVSIHDEIEALNHYLALQSVRFHDTFEYTINTFDSFEDDQLLIPPMIIQPFVENAIEHGIQQLKEKGKISVTLTKKMNYIVCVIEDNGKGIKLGLNAPIAKNKKSLSTAITLERLKFAGKKYNANSGLYISNIAETQIGEKGTKVIINIPFRLNKND